MFEISRHGGYYGAYGHCGHHYEARLTADEIQFPGLCKTEIRDRKSKMGLAEVVNKTKGRRSGQKRNRFTEGRHHDS